MAIKWLERVERHGSRACRARRPPGIKLMPHRDFLEAVRAEKSDVTLQALCDRLLCERGVKSDTSMMSRFFAVSASRLKKVFFATPESGPRVQHRNIYEPNNLHCRTAQHGCGHG